MAIKDNVLNLFEANRGTYYSGEEIAQNLGVSRAAVWKAVNTLRNEGYSIHAVNNKGYCLSLNTDILSPQGICKYLDRNRQKPDIHVLQTTESTNAIVREKANLGYPDGYTVISNQQTAGRGRCGRSFFSPSETGAYLSMLLRPKNCTASSAVRITTMAAVAMCEAIEAVSSEKPQIKWVNDIFIHGKKVCGILTEGSFSLESGLLEYAVLGVGINIYRPAGGFPAPLEDIAGSIFDSQKDDMKNRLVAAFINHFMHYYNSPHPSAYTQKYRQYSLVIGKEISVFSPSGERKAFAEDIDDECRLKVRYSGGETAYLSHGEIKIQL